MLHFTYTHQNTISTHRTDTIHWKHSTNLWPATYITFRKQVNAKKFVTMVVQHAQYHSFHLIAILHIPPHIHSIYDNVLWLWKKISILRFIYFVFPWIQKNCAWMWLSLERKDLDAFIHIPHLEVYPSQVSVWWIWTFWLQKLGVFQMMPTLLPKMIDFLKMILMILIQFQQFMETTSPNETS
jgi:hypothetical protein